MIISAVKNCIVEWAYSSQKAYADPFNDVELDVIFTDPQGKEQRVPAFWSGDLTWRVRFAPAMEGTYRTQSVCSDTGNASLHGITGSLVVSPYQGKNRLLAHGKLQVAADRRHLQHVDGTPFFWLGDTWWMAFTKRLKYPEDFQELATDRVNKGFTLVQIVAGLYPDMDWYDERGANEAGYPWDKGFKSINPAYFDMADIRIAHLVRVGLVPCIVGEWGYFMDFAGIEVLKKHWRYIIARWGAYPVVWCTAGEALMEYYLAEKVADPEIRRKQQQERWSDLVRYIRKTDCFKNPVTIHPTQYGHEQVSDPTLIDVDMLQTGHGGFPTLADTVNMVTSSLEHQPKMPVLVGEVNYEGIVESSREEMQRFIFWSCMLTGAVGHTYGANGIWQVNSPEKPYGPSPHGTAWGNIPWNEAYKLPGSYQIGLGKKLLDRYPWWNFETHLEWVEPHQTPENRHSAYAAGIPGKIRIIFYPANVSWLPWQGKMWVKALESGVKYKAFLFDPKTGQEYDLGVISGDAQGSYTLPKPPIFQDWVLVLERV
jgi:hypothetical protein